MIVKMCACLKPDAAIQLVIYIEVTLSEKVSFRHVNKLGNGHTHEQIIITDKCDFMNTSVEMINDRHVYACVLNYLLYTY